MDYYGSLAYIQKLPKSQRAEEEVYVFAFVKIIIGFLKKQVQNGPTSIQGVLLKHMSSFYFAKETATIKTAE